MAVSECLETLANEAAAADDVTDRMLAIVLAVYSGRAEQLLNL